MLMIMSSRARRPRRPLAAVPPPTTPPPGGADTAVPGIQALVEHIQAGELDTELPVLAAAIAERQQLLAAAHSPAWFDTRYRLLELSPAVDNLWHAAWQEFKAGA